MYDIIVSIVVFQDNLKMVRDTLATLSQTKIKYKVFIIDNSPVPKTKPEVAGLNASYIFSGSNLGYGRGHNLCILNSEVSRYHLLLNPDVFIPPNVIETLIAFMDSHENIGIACPKVLNDDGSIQYVNKRYPSILDLLLRWTLPDSISFLFRKRLDWYVMKDMGYDRIYDIPFVPGFFMLCRSNYLKSIGGFDPRYFLYFEDADLSRSFQTGGLRTIYYPYVNIMHVWNRAPHKNIKMALILMINGIKYFRKWGWKLY